MIEKLPIANRGDWLAWRGRDFTASDMGAMFGCHPYRTALGVYADKRGQGTPRGDNVAMRRGRIMEPAVAAAVAEERPDWRISKCEHYYRDPVDRIGATPDYHLETSTGEGILECKSADPGVFERDWKSGEEAPLCWVLQNLTQQMLTDAAFGAIAVLVMNRALDLYIFDVPRHPAAEARIRAKAKEFWAAVDTDSPPLADYWRDGEAIAALFPREKHPSIDLTGDNRLAQILARRAELSDEISVRDDEKKSIDAEIKHKLGDAEGATLPGWKVTWKMRAGYVAEVKPTRVLRVTDLRARED